FSSRRRHTRSKRDWSSDVCSSDLSELSEKIQRYENNGVQNYRIKAMCIGIPNVGKSTILNRLVGKNVAVTGNKPGVTKNQNWLRSEERRVGKECRSRWSSCVYKHI